MNNPNDISQLREVQQKNMQKLHETHPGLFVIPQVVEDSALLAQCGIMIPDKDIMPVSFLKYAPSDFIVEEILADGTCVEAVETPHETLNSKTEDMRTLYATLVKCNVTTLFAIDEIARQTGIAKEKIGYAGIKDKHAITAQRLSFRDVSYEDIKNVSSEFFFLKDFQYGKGVLQKGSLQGNRFTINLRINSSGFNRDEFELRLEHIRTHGFMNFFYIQRFGTPRLLAGKLGHLIMTGRYEQCVREFICSTSPLELPLFQHIRQKLQKNFGNFKEMLSTIEVLPLSFGYERTLLNHLAQNPKDFVGALKNISEQVTMWVMAFSSLLFNMRLSEYMQLGDIPSSLPLVLSFNKQDWREYELMLRSIKFYPPRFDAIKPFSQQIQIKDRAIDTVRSVDIHEVNFSDDVIQLSFSLNKGEYATTFLSHIVTLQTTKPEEWVSKNIYTTERHQAIVQKFSNVNKPKSADFKEYLAE